jgi:hypothetical protein
MAAHRSPPEPFEAQASGAHRLVSSTLMVFGTVAALTGMVLQEVFHADLQFLTALDVVVIGLVTALTGAWMSRSA